MDLEKNNSGLGSTPALLIIDMINAFTDVKCTLGSDCADVVTGNQELLNAFRSRGRPIFFTTVVYHNNNQARIFRQRLPALEILQPGSHWVEIDSSLAMQKGEVLIEKQLASAFHGTDLDQQLRALGVDSIVVTGLTTSGCVRASAVDGLQYDYQVVVSRDAVGDRNQDAHEANLFDLNAKYADVLSNQEIIQQLPL
jgi:nicotinamidase-related amidase